MIALARMRLVSFARSGRALAPLVAVLVIVATLYGGGKAQAGEAYGVSAVVLFSVLAWQTTLLLDGEPDVQRRLARVALGGLGRESTAGLIAATAAGAPVLALALVLPWVLGGVTGPQRPGDLPLVVGVALGVWAHVVVLLPAVALGALASRAVTRHRGRGLAVLLSGGVGAIVLGLRSSPVPWLAPPVMAAARTTTSSGAGFGAVLPVTLWAVLWAAAATAIYHRLRRSRP